MVSSTAFQSSFQTSCCSRYQSQALLSCAKNLIASGRLYIIRIYHLSKCKRWSRMWHQNWSCQHNTRRGNIWYFLFTFVVLDSGMRVYRRVCAVEETEIQQNSSHGAFVHHRHCWSEPLWSARTCLEHVLKRRMLWMLRTVCRVWACGNNNGLQEVGVFRASGRGQPRRWRWWGRIEDRGKVEEEEAAAEQESEGSGVFCLSWQKQKSSWHPQVGYNNNLRLLCFYSGIIIFNWGREGFWYFHRWNIKCCWSTPRFRFSKWSCLDSGDASWQRRNSRVRTQSWNSISFSWRRESCCCSRIQVTVGLALTSNTIWAKHNNKWRHKRTGFSSEIPSTLCRTEAALCSRQALWYDDCPAGKWHRRRRRRGQGKLDQTRVFQGGSWSKLPRACSCSRTSWAQNSTASSTAISKLWNSTLDWVGSSHGCQLWL